MGIFDKLKKKNGSTAEVSEEKETQVAAEEAETTADEPELDNEPQQEDEVPTFKVDFNNQDEVDARLKQIYNMDKLYVILTAGIADFEHGVSIPMIIMPRKDQKVILVFTDYRKAKKYVTERRPMAVDGILPIAEMKKDDKIHRIDVICANAFAMGIDAIDFDVDDENGIGCKLKYFMDVNEMDYKGQILFSKEEIQKIQENGGKFTPRFNAMPILNFTNPYIITKERGEEIEKLLLSEDSADKAKEGFSIHELCYGANRLMLKSVVDENDGNKEDAQKCRDTVDKLNEVLFEKLSKLDKWYTLVDKETGSIYTQSDNAYLMYTPRYANKMPADTALKEIPPSLAEFAYAVGSVPVKAVAVTDGPNVMHIVKRDVFGF